VPRYVILEHDHPHRHWDLMLESAGVLRTWRLAEPPRPGGAVAAEPIGDHRRAYLDYEGPVSGGRGTVVRWDAGTFEWETDSPRRVAVVLQGTRCRGRALLATAADDGWLFTMEAVG